MNNSNFIKKNNFCHNSFIQEYKKCKYQLTDWMSYVYHKNTKVIPVIVYEYWIMRILDILIRFYLTQIVSALLV